jgi:hypothetical protein
MLVSIPLNGIVFQEPTVIILISRELDSKQIFIYSSNKVEILIWNIKLIKWLAIVNLLMKW